MILSDRDILAGVRDGSIVIEPFDLECLGTNSYDIHLADKLVVYSNNFLDAKKENQTTILQIPDEGFLLRPGRLYLASTVEYTETLKAVPFLEGKSSTGRLGINIHSTAGKGDVGFKNFWTMEITVAMPVMVYAGMPIGQLIYHEISSPPQIDYDSKRSAKYRDINKLPQASRMYKNFQ